MHKKTPNQCKWHNVWVEHDPEEKGGNEFLLRKKFGEYYKTNRQVYVEALKSILIDLNQGKCQEKQG